MIYIVTSARNDRIMKSSIMTVAITMTIMIAFSLHIQIYYPQALDKSTRTASINRAILCCNYPPDEN